MRTRASTEASSARGLGRLVEADSHLRAPEMRPWSKVVVHEDGRTVSVSWIRGAAQGLHSVAVAYDTDCVQIGTRMGTRPAFWNRSGYVVLRMIVEHTVVKLREPLRGRRIEAMAAEDGPVTRIP
jgi:hypothetical protein